MTVVGEGVDPGTSTTLIVAVDRVNGKDYQLFKLIDSSVDSETPTGVVGHPLVVDDPDTQNALALLHTDLTTSTLNVDDADTQVALALILAAIGHTTDATQKTQLVGSTGNIASVSGSGRVQVDGQVSLADNAGFTDGATPLTPIAFILDEVAGTALAENDGAAARIDSKRAQIITIEDATTRGQRLGIDATGRVTTLIAGTSGSVVAVKPASTAAAVGDPALVVSISPNTQPTVIVSGATLDGAAFTPGAGTAFRSALFLVDETAGSTVAEDALGIARMDTKRTQIGVIEDATTRGQRAAVDASGRLAVNVQASASLNLNTARADNAAFTPGSTTTIPASFLVDEVAGGTATEDAAGIARMDSKRAQIIVQEDATTRGQRASIDSNGNQNVALRGGPSFGSTPAPFTATTSTSIFAGSNSAKERVFMNDSDQDLLLGLGNAVTLTVYTVRVRAGGFYSTNFSGSILGMMVAAPTIGQCLVSTLSA